MPRKLKILISTIVLGLLVAVAVCFAADIRVSIVDKSGKVVIFENIVDMVVFTATDGTIILKLRDPVNLRQKTIQLTIGGMTKDVVGIDLAISTVTGIITPVSPSPVPPPVTKPVPPFPSAWWGPKPVDKNGLIPYCAGRTETQAWADWLKAHPEDLDWAWGEYEKSNP